jgi:PST family polysaccharide transporter
MSEANVFLALVGTLMDQGFGSALIQRRDLDVKATSSAAWLMTAAAALFGGATLIVAPLVALIFQTPQLSTVVEVLSVDVVVKGLTIVPSALLIRRFGFADLAKVDVLSFIVGGATGLGVAIAGGGYWSLAAMAITSDAVTLFALLLLVGNRPVRLTFSSIRPLLSFSYNVVGFQWLNYINRNMDNFVIGRWLGPAALGQYSVAYRGMLLPVQYLGWLVERVTLPTYSHHPEGFAGIRRTFLRASQLVGAVAFPLMALAIPLAPIVIPAVLGEPWLPAVLPLQILAFTGARQAVHVMVGSVLLSAGRPQWRFRFQLIATPVYATSFIVGSHWGIVGVAVAYTIAGTLLYPPEAWLALTAIGCKPRDYVFALLGPAAAASAAAIIAGLTSLVIRGIPAVGAAALIIVVGTFTYWAALRLTSPRALAEVKGDLLRLVRA